ncbi:hypothetical protein HanIR_Chr14g0720761 [Helianthus annuus]|nr:hypothetical protein HanIR_Chr14g0720761 [Helianthus annuus]
MRTQKSGNKRPVNMARIIKIPARAISKVLDAYVKGVNNFTNAYNRPVRTMVKVVPNSHRLSRSFTTGFLLDNDQPPEGPLVRSISAPAKDERATNTKLTNVDLYFIQRYCHQMRSCALRKGAPWSSSVGLEKIDEDKSSSFRDDNIVIKSKLCMIKNED